MSLYKYNEIMKALNKGEKPFLFFPIERHEIENMEFKRLDDFFKTVTKVGSRLKYSCGITVSGYDSMTEELFEIDAVKKYVNKMFRRYPYLLYYINKDMGFESWLLSSWADELVAVRRDEHIMNAYESVLKYGGNPPQFPVNTTFRGEKFMNMINGLKAHGVKIGDKTGAIEVANYYSERFN